MSRWREPDDARDEPEDAFTVDLHGLPPERALRRLAQELHAARMRRVAELLVITGRGLGNRTQQPVLRRRVEEWLRGPEGTRAGVRSFALESRGGALRVRLHGGARATEPDEP
jgi:DNA-nicking Smr family endonuclease